MHRRKRPTVFSLFTGAGGLDLGLEAAGFDTRICVELDADARATLQRNRPGWKLATPGDIHQHTPTDLLEQVGLSVRELDLLAGGPPCQPFSKSSWWAGGDSKRLLDPRASTLDAYLQFVRVALPRVMLLENVRGLTFQGKDEGLRLLEGGLAQINKQTGSNYKPITLHINAADYGVPQLRERVFLVASRDGRTFIAPPVTHGGGAKLEPILTAWDAIGDLDTETWPDELDPTGKWARLLPTIPEGQNYLWHTPEGGGEPLFGWRTRYWSFLLKLAKDRPSWTIQAGPGPATGPFHWKSRVLSTRELARLQTFPDDYQFAGDRRAAHRQIGNAVPCVLAEVLGRAIRTQLIDEHAWSGRATLLPVRRSTVPKPERRRPVPIELLTLRGKHRPHPGPGHGPGARSRMISR